VTASRPALIDSGQKRKSRPSSVGLICFNYPGQDRGPGLGLTGRVLFQARRFAGFGDRFFVKLVGSGTNGFTSVGFEDVGGIVFHSNELGLDFSALGALPRLHGGVGDLDHDRNLIGEGKGSFALGFADAVFGVPEDLAVVLALHIGVVEGAVDVLHARIDENDDRDGGTTTAVGFFDHIRKSGGFSGIDDDALGEGENCFAGRHTDGSGAIHSCRGHVFLRNDEGDGLLGFRCQFAGGIELGEIVGTLRDVEGTCEGTQGQTQGEDSCHASFYDTGLIWEFKSMV